MWQDDPAAFVSQWGCTSRQARWLRCTAEHLVARQDRGTDARANIVAACLHCNTRRHLGRQRTAPSASVFKAQVERLMARGRWHPANLPLLPDRRCGGGVVGAGDAYTAARATLRARKPEMWVVNAHRAGSKASL
ncbi:HNH endonuclease [Variovorax sp. LjRoot175]|uniref:HNH endonuclease n=1 Tax=Variovorax sp. LjRoot175 TaxID=3342276 RepID=UPI003ED01BE1